jgi:endosialidase-like protein
MNPLTQLKNTTILPVVIALVLACFGLSPQARATCQEGCFTNSNTVLGEDAFLNNFDGHDNTASGFQALHSNFSAYGNTANGSNALYYNTTGLYNTATGNAALYNNVNGLENTASGVEALYTNNAGNGNAAIGAYALHSNTRGQNNIAVGYNALFSNTFGSKNIAVGSEAGFNLTTGSHNIDIGNPGVAGEAKAIRIGNQGTQTATFIAGISGATVPTGVPVIVDATGHLGTTTSSARFKDAIKPMDKASEAIFSLKPVTFHYKKDLDPEGVPQFGLVAEQVEKVNPDLVARDEQGKPYTVRYEAVNAMLLNEFLKEHKAFVEEQQKVQEQGETIARQQKQIEALTAGLQKVSAQLELSKPAPQTVLNNH